jgi:multidrug efflux system membrane fusion protein
LTGAASLRRYRDRLGNAMTLNRRLGLACAALAAVAVLAVGGIRLIPAPKAAAPKGGGAVPVTAATVVSRDVPVRLTAIGNVEPLTTVAVKARVDGQLVAVHFREGDEVKKGAVLFEIDRRPFEATLKQAQANLARDRALQDHADEQQKRYQDLLERKFISPDAFEQVKTNAQTAAATTHADEAAIESAQLQFDYCTIAAPVTGYAGRIMIQQGNLVKANDTNPLVVINQIIPVDVTFSVPEQNLAQVRQYQADGELSVTASLANSTHPPVPGRLAFIDNTTDIATGTIKLKAEFPNTDKVLWPGQFANVVLTLYQQRNAVVAPASAVQNGPNGQYVFIVNPDATVATRAVKVAYADGDDAVIASGLNAGDKVVTTGQLRLAPGMRVTETPAAKAS